MEPLTIALCAAVIVVTVLALAPKVGVAAPLLLVAIGVGLSLVPAMPAVHVDPEWILAGVLPPLLYATSVNMPAMDFRRDLNAIAGLSVALVVITSVLLGLLFSRLIPDVDLAMGVALGAVISPTDAVATSMVRRLGVGQRVVTVLEGESLLNDASALVVLRTAIAATAASVSLWGAVGDFLFAVVVAAAIGVVVGRLSLWVRSKVSDPHLTTAISFTVPFVAYLPAEHLGASGLVATVAAGLVTGFGSARHLRPQDRLTQSANWHTLALLLEGAVFLVMGLQLRGLVVDVWRVHGSVFTALGLALAATAVVLTVRSAYVAALLNGLSRRARRSPAVKELLSAFAARAERLDTGGARTGTRSPTRTETRRRRVHEQVTRRVADLDYLAARPLGVREGAVLTWAGMRGVVTVAAAQTLPADAPHRSLLVLVAFTVATGTLLVQGSTLDWLVRRLGLARRHGDGGEDLPDLTARMRAAAVRALERDDFRRRDGEPFDPVVLDRVRRITTKPEDDGAADAGADRRPDELLGQLRELRLAVLEAQREELLRIRDLGTASSTALNRALRIIDAEQISTELRESPT